MPVAVAVGDRPLAKEAELGCDRTGGDGGDSGVSAKNEKGDALLSRDGERGGLHTTGAARSSGCSDGF